LDNDSFRSFRLWYQYLLVPQYRRYGTTVP